MKLLFKSISILIITTVLASCNSVSNYNLIKEFFEQTKDSKSAFSVECDWSQIIDTVVISEIVNIHSDSFRYSIEFDGDIFEIGFWPGEVKVIKDSCDVFSVTEYVDYTRNTANIFTMPDFELINGVYREYNNEDRNGNDSLSFETDWSYPYRVYLSIDNKDLVIHRDFSFKTESSTSYFFSKQKGLYKLLILVDGGQCTLLKIEE